MATRRYRNGGAAAGGRMPGESSQVEFGVNEDRGAPILSAPWDRARDRRTAALLFLFVWVIYLATATYDSFQVNDNRAVNISAWSLGTRGTLELPAHFEGSNRWVVEGRDGALYTNRFPGAVLWATPFHAVGEMFIQRGVPDHGVFISHAPGGVAAATVTALAVLVSYLVFRRLADRKLALASAVVLAFGTGVWSVSADAMWTHGLTHLTLMLGLLAASEGRNVRSGLAFAAAILTRPHTAAVAAVVGLWAGRHTRGLRPIVTIGLLSVFGAALVSAYSRVIFGTWQPIAGYRSSAIADVATSSWAEMGEKLIATMAHPVRGVFIFTPFLLLLIPFVRRGWRASPWWVRSSAIGGLLYLTLQLRVNPWAGGGGYFGSRLTLETLVLSAPLLLRTWQSTVRHNERLKGAAVGLMTVAIGIHAVGATIRSIDPDARTQWQTELAQLCVAEPDLDGCQ
jgi:hypothetical protein